MCGNINERGLGQNLDDMCAAQLLTDGCKAWRWRTRRYNRIGMVHTRKCTHLRDYVTSVDGDRQFEQGLVHEDDALEAEAIFGE